jgi:hypothetical protein
MKKIGIVSLVLGFLALGLLPRPASAQADVVTIDIPFTFMVGDTKLAPGTYEIAKVDTWSYRISTPKGDQKVLFTTEATTMQKAAPSYTLYFNVYGDTYYLAKFFHQGQTSGFLLVMSAAEKALAAKGPATTKTVTSKKK